LEAVTPRSQVFDSARLPSTARYGRRRPLRARILAEYLCVGLHARYGRSENATSVIPVNDFAQREQLERIRRH